MRQIIGQILINRVTRADAVAAAAGNTAPFDDATVCHLVAVICDDLHAHRLRHVWTVLSERLGKNFAWLNFTSPSTAQCPDQRPPFPCPGAGGHEGRPQPPSPEPGTLADNDAAVEPAIVTPTPVGGMSAPAASAQTPPVGRVSPSVTVPAET